MSTCYHPFCTTNIARGTRYCGLHSEQFERISRWLSSHNLPLESLWFILEHWPPRSCTVQQLADHLGGSVTPKAVCSALEERDRTEFHPWSPVPLNDMVGAIIVFTQARSADQTDPVREFDFEDEILTIDEAARAMNVSRPTPGNWAKNGLLGNRDPGNKLYLLSELVAFSRQAIRAGNPLGLHSHIIEKCRAFLDSVRLHHGLPAELIAQAEAETAEANVPIPAVDLSLIKPDFDFRDIDEVFDSTLALEIDIPTQTIRNWRKNNWLPGHSLADFVIFALRASHPLNPYHFQQRTLAKLASFLIVIRENQGLPE